MASNLPAVLAATTEDIKLLLAAQSHIGGKNVMKSMSPYVYKRRPDGINIINIGKTWEKIVLAARVLVTIENAADICAVSARPYGQRAVLKFAQYTGATAIAGRYTPGTMTNYGTRQYKEPRVLVITDPRVDHQAIRESAYANIPVIAFCDTETSLRFVDIAIPINNKSRCSIGLAWWLLTREVLRLRGTITREAGAWDVMVDMFFYRDPEEVEKEAQDAALAKIAAAESASADYVGQAATQLPDWDVQGAGVGGIQPGLAAAVSHDATAVATDDWATPAAGVDWAADVSTTTVPAASSWA